MNQNGEIGALLSRLRGQRLASRPADGDRGGIRLAEPRRFGFLKAGQRAFRNRQFDMVGGGKLHGSRKVFLGGRNPESRLSERGAAENFSDDRAAAFHGGGCPGGVG